MGAQDSSIPMNIMQQATCVAVVPGMIKGAFVFGGQYGQGVVTCRTGHGWSAPVFIRMAGGSFGFQIGGQSTDLVLVAVNDRGFQDLLKNKFKIGGDASAAAGPVGRSGQAATDWKMNAELLSYSRNKGIFAGIDLDGTSVSQNVDDTDVYYGAPHHFETILKGDVGVPPGRSTICSRRGPLLCRRQEPQVAAKPIQLQARFEFTLRGGPHLAGTTPFDFARVSLRSRSRTAKLVFAFNHAGKTRILACRRRGAHLGAHAARAGAPLGLVARR